MYEKVRDDWTRQGTSVEEHAMRSDDGFKGYTRVITFSLWQDDEFDVI